MNRFMFKLSSTIAVFFAFIAIAHALCDCPEIIGLAENSGCVPNGPNAFTCWKKEYTPYKDNCSEAVQSSCLECFVDPTPTVIVVNNYYGAEFECEDCLGNMVPLNPTTELHNQAYNNDTMCGGNS